MSDEPRVLIIEDNDVLRVMLFTILRHQPLGVDAVRTAEEALQRVTSCDYALIVVDMDLADDESTKFLTAFRDQRPEATTFVLAVRSPRGVDDVALDASLVDAVLSKPIEIDTLAEVVRECAHVVPLPEDPLPCPPAESDLRSRHFEDSGSFYSN
jgi:DNA-binding response OmpR family regulator